MELSFRCAWITFAGSAILSGPALVNDVWAAAATGQPDALPGTGLEEITVTAERKDTALSKTPVTVNVLSADALAQAQIATEGDLRSAVPGLIVQAGTNSNQLDYSIRGNSQDAFSGTRPGVLPYVNDVQIGGSGVSSAFYDLQSVQVLKGPQGTLFGRSATGGAVLFTTTKPTDTFGGYASAAFGDFATKKFEGALNLPLIPDDLFFRVAGFFSQHDGFQYNLYDNTEIGSQKRKGVRISLRANMGPSIQNDLMVDYYQADGGSMVGVISGLMPPSATPGTPPYIPLQFLYAGVATPLDRATGIATLQALTGAPANVAAAFYNAYFYDPRRPSTGLTGTLAAQQARGPYVVDTNALDASTARHTIVTNETVFKLTGNTSIKNIVGYTDLKDRVHYDADGTPYSIVDNGPADQLTPGFFYPTKQVSDELQLLGKAVSERLDYVMGLYYSHEKFGLSYTNYNFDLLFGGQQSPRDFEVRNETYAGYAQGTYKLNDSGLAITVGARGTTEQVRLVKLPGDADLIAHPVAPPGFDYDQSRTFNTLSWNLGTQDQLTSDLMLYVASRRAYKSGGFNGNAPAQVGYGDTAGDAFRQERITDVETGAKFNGRALDMPLRINAAVYNQWLEDAQHSAYALISGTPASITINVPDEKVYGVELEGEIQPHRWLNIGGNINYMHARFGSKPVVVLGNPLVFDQVPVAPEWSGVAFAELSLPLSKNLTGILHGDFYAQAKSYTSPRSQNSAGTIIPGYGVANFRIGLQGDPGWSLTANVKNAFDRTYYVGGLSAGEIFQINVLVPAEPRTYTVEARYTF
jgi:iron complex outermembrane receptor protein